MISLSHVSKFFISGKNAVDDISFEVADGEILVLLGTSGCGKTTTLRMINRLLEPSSGVITINGKNIKELPVTTLRKGIGYVLQNNGLFPHYTVAENISTVPQLLGWSQEKTRARYRTLMEKLELPPDTYENVYPAQLSGGQQQRVGLARALAADPPLLLMDEPFGALDPLTRTSVRKEFRKLDELNTKTVVLVTHDIEEAFDLGDRICLMSEGRIQQLGSPAALLFSPANDFVRHFFDGQRLKLELSVLKVKDIWDTIPSSPPTPDYQELTADETCWNLLAALTYSKVAVKYNNQVKRIDGDAIMNGLHRYKQQ